MIAERTDRHTSEEYSAARVVILDLGPEARIVRVRLPYDAAVGTCFEHDGTRWAITALRTHRKVFIAEPLH